MMPSDPPPSIPVSGNFARIFCRWMGGHRWRYGGTGAFTGYVERCDRCGEIRQVPQ